MYIVVAVFSCFLLLMSLHLPLLFRVLCDGRLNDNTITSYFTTPSILWTRIKKCGRIWSWPNLKKLPSFFSIRSGKQENLSNSNLLLPKHKSLLDVGVCSLPRFDVYCFKVCDVNSMQKDRSSFLAGSLGASERSVTTELNGPLWTGFLEQWNTASRPVFNIMVSYTD
jgi:hypothetical protein